MVVIDKSTQRVIAVITLLVLAAWTLRGYLPGIERVEERERPASNPAATAAVVVMVSVAVAIIGFAIILRIRERRPRPASSGEFPRRRGGRARPSLRFTLVALALVIGWLLLVLILLRLGGEHGPVQQPTSGPGSVPDAPSTPAPPSNPAPRSDDPAPDTGVFTYLIPPMVVLMAFVVVGTAITSRRQKRHTPPHPVDDIDEAPTTPAAADTLARAAEVGLAEIADLSREPREAIIACYAAMERELTRVPGAVPQDFDTPTEVLARAVEHRALRADSATELVELFEEARFSPHVMTEAHRDAAVRVLQRVHTELPQALAGGVT